MAKTNLVFGRDLRIGDTVDVWWGTNRDTIVAMRPYAGPLARLAGARIAQFAVNQMGMTLEAGALFEVFHRTAEAA